MNLKNSQDECDSPKSKRVTFSKNRGFTYIPKKLTKLPKHKSLSTPVASEVFKITISPELDNLLYCDDMQNFTSVETFNISPRKTFKTSVTLKQPLAKREKDIISQVMEKFSSKAQDDYSSSFQKCTSPQLSKAKLPSFIRKNSSASTCSNASLSKKELININVNIPDFRRQKSLVSPRQYDQMNELLQKINDEDAYNVKKLRKSLKDCQLDLSSRIEDLRKTAKLDFDAMRQQRAKR
mmetsp:Transcript_27707/g.27401  ORF Transcript_27707/g.27401 Transcript_27707/m.27401 type:complete len:238 (-) Transcript_27707:106-819(-)